MGGLPPISSYRFNMVVDYTYGKMFRKVARNDPSPVWLQGDLSLSPKDKFLSVRVPWYLQRGAYDALGDPSVRIPGPAHISVVLPEELEEKKIDPGSLSRLIEQSRRVKYRITDTQSVVSTKGGTPVRWWFLKVDSPDLQKLRRKAGLPPLVRGNQQFHITFGRKEENGPLSEKRSAIGRIKCAEAWRKAAAKVAELVDRFAENALLVRRLERVVPSSDLLGIFQNRDGSFWVKAGACAGDWREALSDNGCKVVDSVEPHPIPLIVRPSLEKSAADPYLSWYLKLLGAQPGLWPVNPGPLVSMGVGGALGAGLGYGAGALASRVLPDDWNKKRLRYMLAGLGAGAGIAPGALAAARNVYASQPFWSTYSTGQAADSGELYNPYGFTYDKADGLLSGDPVDIDRYEIGLDRSRQGDHGELIKYVSGHGDLLDKSGSATADWGSGGFDPLEFQSALWRDPRNAERLSPPQQAAASILVNNAVSSGGDTRWVTPADMARAAAGMGSGYLSGAVVGKALGVLMGMPDSAQSKLRQTGMWAGTVANLLPLVYR